MGAAHHHIFEMVGYRGLVGVAAMAVIARGAGRSLLTQFPRAHVYRGVIGMTALVLWFYGLTGLPLATSMTLSYTAAIFLAAIMATRAFFSSAHARPDSRLVAAILISFAGVALLLKPTISSQQLLFGLAGLISGILSAFAYQQIQTLAKLGEPEYRVVFYFSLAGVIVGFVAAIGLGEMRMPNWQGTPWLIAIGILATLGQLFLTRAYGSGNTLVVANTQYSGVLISVALGYVLFNETIDWIGALGAALIAICGIAAVQIGKPARVATEET
jgi:S-adenosylmethionine uptake transporter